MEYVEKSVKCLTNTGVELHCIMNSGFHMVVRDYQHNEGRKNGKKKKQELSVRLEPRFIPISSRLF